MISTRIPPHQLLNELTKELNTGRLPSQVLADAFNVGQEVGRGSVRAESFVHALACNPAFVGDADVDNPRVFAERVYAVGEAMAEEHKRRREAHRVDTFVRIGCAAYESSRSEIFDLPPVSDLRMNDVLQQLVETVLGFENRNAPWPDTWPHAFRALFARQCETLYRFFA